MTEFRPELKHAIEALGLALKDTPVLRAYAQASANLAVDREATGLLDELQRVQTDVRLRQSNGGLDRAVLARLRQLQDDVQSNRTIAAYIEAQQFASLALPEVNREISEMLGVDFAALGRVNTC